MFEQLELPFGASARRNTDERRIWLLAQDLTAPAPQRGKRFFINPGTGAAAFGVNDILLLRSSSETYQVYLSHDAIVFHGLNLKSRVLGDIQNLIKSAKKPVSKVVDVLSMSVTPGRARRCGVLDRTFYHEARTEFEAILFRQFEQRSGYKFQLLNLVKRALPALERSAHPAANASLQDACAQILMERWHDSQDERYLIWADDCLTGVERNLTQAASRKQAQAARKSQERISTFLCQPPLPGFEPLAPSCTKLGFALQRASGFPLLISGTVENSESNLAAVVGAEHSPGFFECIGDISWSDDVILGILKGSSDPMQRICVRVTPAPGGYAISVATYDEFDLFAWGCGSHRLTNRSRHTHVECETLEITRHFDRGLYGDEYTAFVSRRTSSHNILAFAETNDGGCMQVEFSLSPRLTSEKFFV